LEDPDNPDFGARVSLVRAVLANVVFGNLKNESRLSFSWDSLIDFGTQRVPFSIATSVCLAHLSASALLMKVFE